MSLPSLADAFGLINRERVIDVLSRPRGLSPELVAAAIPLLAWAPAADHALFALRNVAEERVGQLIDALLDPAQDHAVRRRLARVFSVCVSQRAAEGLILALDDDRRLVRRFQHAADLGAGAKLQDGAFEPKVQQELLERAVVLEEGLRLAAGRAEQRRLGDVEIALLDDLHHLAVEEGQQ